ncbi:TPA: hypothetical protein ACGO6M_002220 [Streptococcus suis]
MQKIISNNIAKNVLLSLTAQIISLGTSLVINLLVPKYIDGFQYALWQTYILYASYTGILHLGILDGITLRYSKYDYNELNKEKFSSNFWFLVFILTSFSTLGILISIFLLNGNNQIIFSMVSLSIITKNLFMFSSNSFQITNRINLYTKLVIKQRFIYGLLTILLIILNQKMFILYCIADLISDILGFISTFSENNEIYKYFNNITNNKEELFENLKSGISLMIANFSSNFIVGSSKIYIQTFWGAIIFGQVSFGFSITNLFLSFVTAISIVLFPSIKRMDKSELTGFYFKVRNLISPLLFFALLFYFPGSKFLSYWLPNYQQSLVYAGVLLPIIIYSARISLLINNYFKAFRLEKELLKINLTSIVLELIGLFLIHCFFKNVLLILIWTVVVTVIKSMWSEFIICKLFSVNILFDNVLEIVLISHFIIFNLFFSSIYSFILYFLLFCFYLFLKIKFLK